MAEAQNNTADVYLLSSDMTSPHGLKPPTAEHLCATKIQWNITDELKLEFETLALDNERP